MGIFDFLKPQSIPDTQTEATDCAWCLDEQGLLNAENQQEGDSHGICEDHSNQVRYNHQVNRYNRVPSYVERFKDGREKF